jgi:hypothetical protein
LLRVSIACDCDGTKITLYDKIFVLFGLEHLKHKLDRHNLRVINFDSVWFFFLKNNQIDFFFWKKIETAPKPGQTDWFQFGLVF